MEILRVENATKTYHMEGEDIRALRDVTFSLDAGDITVILGPSGSGKSTLLTLLGGLSSPSEGKVFCKGKSLYDMHRGELAAWRNKLFGFVFQFHYLMPELTALENVILPGQVARRDYDECKERAEKLLAHVGLSERLNHKPGELSGGEQQRVAVCRALMNEPEIILADEPTGNLDLKTAEGIHDVLWDLCQKEGRTLIVVTHYEPLAKRADHILALESGQVTKKRGVQGGEEKSGAKKTVKAEAATGLSSNASRSGTASKIEFASRWKRLFGYLIDLAFVSPGLFLLQTFNFEGSDLLILLKLSSLQIMLCAGIFNFILLIDEGKTIGKLFMRIHIEKLKTGENGGFFTNIVLRNLWVEVGGLIYLYFNFKRNGFEVTDSWIYVVYIFFDFLFIFFPSRRCLHDYIAGTKVVRDKIGL